MFIVTLIKYYRYFFNLCFNVVNNIKILVEKNIYKRIFVLVLLFSFILDVCKACVNIYTFHTQQIFLKFILSTLRTDK